MPGKIFVNYRREDTRDMAARVRDRLAQTFGNANVFMDVDNLMAGQRFDRELGKALGATDVFLAVIGPRWMESLGERQASGDRDYVREEIAGALQRGIVVIPVLIEPTQLPRQDTLPEDIRELVLHQKYGIGHEQFGRDVAGLAEAIRFTRKRARGEASTYSALRPRIAIPAALALLAAGLLAYLLGMPMPWATGTNHMAQQQLEQEKAAREREAREREAREREAREREAREREAREREAREREAREREAREREAKEREAEKTKIAADKALLDARIADEQRKQMALLKAQEDAKRALEDKKRAEQDLQRPGQVFRDCTTCPEMVVLPAGNFDRGSSLLDIEGYDNERPQHKVTIARPFAVGKYEVTFVEWDDCVLAGRCTYRPHDNNWGRGRQPVINVSWADIGNQYLPWLSSKTGKSYRLLTEAEWEYAARGGSLTRFPWGNAVGRGNANCWECGTQWEKKQTAPVGSFRPNAFGLYDMLGNIEEWVQDCFHDNYSGAPLDGSAWMVGGTCSLRMLRGGSWTHDAKITTSTSRNWFDPNHRNANVGFRVARSLTQ